MDHTIRAVFRIRVLRFVLLLGSAALAPAPCGAAALTVQGSSTFNSEIMAGHREGIEAATGVMLEVIANKSNFGLLALLDGAADLAMISTELRNELELVGRGRPDLSFDRLQVHQIAHTRIALVVHPANPVRGIGEEALRRVMAGEATNWRELGGEDRPIRIVAIREGGGTINTLEPLVLGAGRHLAAPDQIRPMNGSQVVRIVEQEAGALGIAQVKLSRGRAVRELATPRSYGLALSLVSLGDPSPAMLDVIRACRDVATAEGLAE